MSTSAGQPLDPRLAKLQAGKPLVFPAPPTDGEETPEEIAARTIPAKWLEELAARPARVVSVPVVISDAIIDGPLDLQYAGFEYGLSITGTEFKDKADFSFAVFKRTATFEGSEFAKPAIFRATHAEADFEIAGASLPDGSSFQDLHVNEVLNAAGAKFGAVDFDRIEISKSAFFRSEERGHRTTFAGNARFLGAHFYGIADFSGAEFKAKAAFDGLQVHGDTFFRSDVQGRRVTFGAEARFHGAHIRGNAEFEGAEFNATAAFDGMQVEGDAFFRNDVQGHRVTFGGETRFHGTRIQGNAEFDGAEFKSNAVFYGMQVDGNAFFRKNNRGQAVTFDGAARFPSAVFRSDAEFVAASFRGDTDFDNAHFHGAVSFRFAEFASGRETTLIGARFERGAYFDSVRFGGQTDFTAAVGSRDVTFRLVEFSGPASFREASFQVVQFDEPEEQVSGLRLPLRAVLRLLKQLRGWLLRETEPRVNNPVDLRGFTYDRISVNLDELLPRIATTDRQPYTQLEQALRKVGDDARANQVYLERRRVERKRMFSEGRHLRWAMDCAYKAIANYGIRPYRLIGWTLLLLLLGTWFFSPPGAVKPRDDKRAAAAMTDLAGHNVARALGVSVHQFLPIDVPVGSEWVPASEKVSIPFRVGKRCICIRVRPSVYGTLLRIAGAILVGIGLGSVTGLLRRVSP